MELMATPTPVAARYDCRSALQTQISTSTIPEHAVRQYIMSSISRYCSCTLYITHAEDKIVPACHNQREEYFRNRTLPWEPTCDCDGLYKAKQCDRDSWDPETLVCWCSYRNSFSQVANTRRRIADICTDPATL